MKGRCRTLLISLLGYRRSRQLILLVLFSGIAILGVTNGVVIVHAGDRCFDTVESIPKREFGLVLGASPYTLYYQNRLNAAATLYKAGKVKHFLVSGDNGTVFYDESSAMKKGLIKRGVPAGAITCDYAGFRTFDSVIRSRKIFGLKQMTIISQKFHNSRAVYIASFCGIDAIAFNAEQPSLGFRSRTLLREVAARTVAFVELHITGRQPRFLGKKEPIETVHVVE